MNLDERDTVAAQFGVSPEQVERDHLISHLLAAIADRFADRVHFIGTALARTPLPSQPPQRRHRPRRVEQPHHIGNRTRYRTRTRRRADLRSIDMGADTRCRQRHRSGESPHHQRLVGQDPAAVVTRPHRMAGRTRQLEQRYSDAPPATLTVPTLAAFVAAKTATWHDRRAPRPMGSVCAGRDRSDQRRGCRLVP